MIAAEKIFCAAVLLPLILSAAPEAPFQLKTSIGKTVYPVGARVPVTVTVTYPASHEICLISAYSYVTGLPADFIKKTGFKVNPYKKGSVSQWDTVKFGKTQWLPSAQRSNKTFVHKIDTSKWLPGDYNVQLHACLHAKDGKTKPVDKYVQSSVSFTLE